MKITLINPIYLTIILVSAAGLAFGLYGAFPMGMRELWQRSKWLLLALTIIITAAIWIGKTEFLIIGINGTVQTSRNFFLTIALLMIMFGFMTPVAEHLRPMISRLLSGPFGYPSAAAGATLSVNTSMFNPAVQMVWRSTAAARPVLLYMLMAAPMVSLNVFVFRMIGITDPDIKSAMYRASFTFAFTILPFFCWLWGKVLPL